MHLIKDAVDLWWKSYKKLKIFKITLFVFKRFKLKLNQLTIWFLVQSFIILIPTTCLTITTYNVMIVNAFIKKRY